MGIPTRQTAAKKLAAKKAAAKNSVAAKAGVSKFQAKKAGLGGGTKNSTVNSTEAEKPAAKRTYGRKGAPAGPLIVREARVINYPDSPTSFDPYLSGPQGRLNDYMADVESTEKEQFVLDHLQSTNDTPLHPVALHMLLNLLIEALPEFMKDRIMLHMGAPDDGTNPDAEATFEPPPWFLENDAAFEKTFQRYQNLPFPSLGDNKKEYIVWVFNVAAANDQPHFDIILMRMKTTNPLVPDLYNRVGYWSIVDTMDNYGENTLAHRGRERVTRLLKSKGVSEDARRVKFCPFVRKGYEFASGFIAYAVIADTLVQLGVQSYLDTGFDADFSFGNVRPWMNTDQIRAEMLGQVCFRMMKKMKYKGRVGVFPVKPAGKNLGALAAKPPPVGGFHSDDPSFGEGSDKETPLDSFAKKADKAVLEAKTFATRVQREVLDNPVNSVPTALAIERLGGLVKRAEEACSSVELAIHNSNHLGNAAEDPAAANASAEKYIARLKVNLADLLDARETLDVARHARGDRDQDDILAEVHTLVDENESHSPDEQSLGGDDANTSDDVLSDLDYDSDEEDDGLQSTPGPEKTLRRHPSQELQRADMDEGNEDQTVQANGKRLRRSKGLGEGSSSC